MRRDDAAAHASPAVLTACIVLLYLLLADLFVFSCVVIVILYSSKFQLHIVVILLVLIRI